MILDDIYYNTLNDENVDYYHISRVYCFVHEAQLLEVKTVQVYRISSLRRKIRSPDDFIHDLESFDYQTISLHINSSITEVDFVSTLKNF